MNELRLFELLARCHRLSGTPGYYNNYNNNNFYDNIKARDPYVTVHLMGYYKKIVYT